MHGPPELLPELEPWEVVLPPLEAPLAELELPNVVPVEDSDVEPEP